MNTPILGKKIHKFDKIKLGACSELKIAGHWCPADMVTNIDSDCGARKARGEKKLPVRLLIPVGGAGAQRKFVTSFLEALEKPIRRGEVREHA